MDDEERALSQDRWRRAQHFLDGRSDAEAERLLRRDAYRRRLAIGIPVLVSLVLGVVVVLIVAHRSGSEPRHVREVATWRAILGLSLQAVGLGLEGVAIVRNARARRSLGAATPLTFLSRIERKQLLAQVRGRVAPVPSQVPLARDLASRLVSQRIALFAAGVGLLVIGQAIASTVLWYPVFVALALPLLVAGALKQRRDTARAQRFLADHPDPRSKEPQLDLS